MFNSRDGTTFDDMRKKRVFERAIRLWRRATLSKAWQTWITNFLELQRTKFFFLI